MRLRDDDRNRALIARRIAQKGAPNVVAQLTEEWFPEERAFFDDPAQLAAALCSRRAGKTRGEAKDFLRDLLTIPGYRGLYLNTTRGEAERLMWWGNRGDGVATLSASLGLGLKANNSTLELHNPKTDGRLYLRGADDEAELRKALGGAYHKVYWDEWQKIPPKLAQSIREVFFPALLDFGGKFRGTGTPSRQTSGIAWDVTRPEKHKRQPGWSVHEWTLLQNPYWGREKFIGGRWFVVWGARDEVVSGPHDESDLKAAIVGCRWTKGILALQTLYGGPDVAPIDSPIMQREGFGRWTREDSSYVYAVNKVPDAKLVYAPHRARPDGFPDVRAALADLPGDWREYLYALGVDLGYNDPFTFTLWAWHPHNPTLFEVCSYKKSELDTDMQNAAIQAVRAHVAIGVIDADAGGIGKAVVKGWSAEWVTRYNLPIFEAEKQHKLTAINTFNTDILQGFVKFRDGGPLLEEMKELCWATIVDGSGRMIEDPTMPNDVCDSGLYGHRRSFAFRWSPQDIKPPPGSHAALIREEEEIERDMLEDDESVGIH